MKYLTSLLAAGCMGMLLVAQGSKVTDLTDKEKLEVLGMIDESIKAQEKADKAQKELKAIQDRQQPRFNELGDAHGCHEGALTAALKWINCKSVVMKPKETK